MRRTHWIVGIVAGCVGGVALALVSPGVAQDGGAAAPPAPQAPPAENPVLVEARKSVHAMRAQIEAISPRRFTQDVTVAWQTEAEFKAYMTEQLDKELNPATEKGYTAMLVALRLLPQGVDLRALLLDTVASQALAHYVPDRDTFYVLKELPAAMRNGTYLHELQHAMQDQVLGLDAMQAQLQGITDQGDRGQALRFVWEGEARFLQTLYEVKSMQGVNLLDMPELGDMALKQQAEMPFEQRMQMMMAQGAQMGGAIGQSMTDQAKLPRYLLQSLQDAYLRGLWTAWRAWRVGGWEGVDRLFSNPPTSTEQVLHPDAKLFGDKREEPVKVTLPDLTALVGDDRAMLTEDVVGEHNCLILFQMELPAADAARAGADAAGWGGDRIRVYAAPADGAPLVVWLSVWDTAGDAGEFAAAYTACAAANAGLGRPAAVVRHEGLAVAVVEGADAELGGKLAAALLAAAPTPPQSGDGDGDGDK